jgi:hypothetical protein
VAEVSEGPEGSEVPEVPEAPEELYLFRGTSEDQFGGLMIDEWLLRGIVFRNRREEQILFGGWTGGGEEGGMRRRGASKYMIAQMFLSFKFFGGENTAFLKSHE